MNQAEFSEFIRNSGFEPREIAKTVEVSIPTVKRWATGSTMPAPYIVDLVIQAVSRMKDEAMTKDV